jgi:antirestriction protein ArdC
MDALRELDHSEKNLKPFYTDIEQKMIELKLRLQASNKEIVHWSGHPARLQRQFGKRFGDQDYAFEELVAEIGAAFLGASTGIPFEEMRHPGYIDSWLRILKQDNRAIFTAAAKAQTAADFVLDKAGMTAEEAGAFPKRHRLINLTQNGCLQPFWLGSRFFLPFLQRRRPFHSK